MRLLSRASRCLNIPSFPKIPEVQGGSRPPRASRGGLAVSLTQNCTDIAVFRWFAGLDFSAPLVWWESYEGESDELTIAL